MLASIRQHSMERQKRGDCVSVLVNSFRLTDGKKQENRKSSIEKFSNQIIQTEEVRNVCGESSIQCEEFLMHYWKEETCKLY